MFICFICLYLLFSLNAMKNDLLLFVEYIVVHVISFKMFQGLLVIMSNLYLIIYKSSQNARSQLLYVIWSLIRSNDLLFETILRSISFELCVSQKLCCCSLKYVVSCKV